MELAKSIKEADWLGPPGWPAPQTWCSGMKLGVFTGFSNFMSGNRIFLVPGPEPSDSTQNSEGKHEVSETSCSRLILAGCSKLQGLVNFYYSN